MRKYLILLLITLSLPALWAQETETAPEKPTSIPMFYGFYGYQWPGGDLADQFGSNSIVGPGFQVKTSSNWIFGAEYHFFFGNNVKNGKEIFKYLLDSDGNIISGDGTPALVATFERGNAFSAKFGKLFPVSKNDRNSGVFFTAGIGYMMHKIRIEVENESAPQLKGDYKRGYDRLSGGLMLNQAVGFMYFGNSRLLNFTFSIEAYEGFTKPYRDYYFDTMAPPPSKHQFDFLIGPKIAWMLPLRARNADKYYYY